MTFRIKGGSDLTVEEFTGDDNQVDAIRRIMSETDATSSCYNFNTLNGEVLQNNHEMVKTYLAKLGNAHVGFISVEHFTRSILVLHMAVDKKVQRLCIGSRLLSIFKAQSNKAIVAVARTRDSVFNSFLLKHGFEKDMPRQIHYGPGDGGWRWSWTLAEQIKNPVKAETHRSTGK